MTLSLPLQIAIVTETYPPEINGVASTIARFINGLHECGHSISLIRPRQGRGDQARDQERFSEVLVSGIPIPGYSALKIGLPEKNMLTRKWAKQRPDLVHLVTEGPLGWSALQAAKKLGIPVCSDFRTNFDAYSSHYGFSWLKSSIQKYMRYFHNRSNFTMVPTKAMREQLHKQGFERLKVVARGIDTDLFSPTKRCEKLRRRWGLKEKNKAVLYVGRLASEKNLLLSVDAFKAMLKIDPSLKMIWVGDGPERAALELSCPSSIFAGMQTGESLAQYYASSDIFLFSSISETFGNVTLEAMASGLAVVAFDYAAAQQFIQNGSNGLLAEMNNSSAFIAQSQSIVRDSVDLQHISQQARLTTLDHSWQKVTKHLEDNYRDLIHNSKTDCGVMSKNLIRC
jgi:glycosyltransferase involved in cell wall biosynthesis